MLVKHKLFTHTQLKSVPHLQVVIKREFNARIMIIVHLQNQGNFQMDMKVRMDSIFSWSSF